MVLDPNSTVNLTVIAPVLSQEQFAAFIGSTKDTVRGWVENNTVPNVKIGRQCYVNVIAFVEDLKNGKTIFSRGDYSDD